MLIAKNIISKVKKDYKKGIKTKDIADKYRISLSSVFRHVRNVERNKKKTLADRHKQRII